jgi:enterochelin esterase-like enzyme
MEYKLELTRADGAVEIECDPGNPLRAPGPFGAKSVLELPAYRQPAWLPFEPPAGRTKTLDIPSRTLGATVALTIWSPPGIGWDRPLPLLVVHDGVEYREYSQLVQFFEAGRAAGELPFFRAALLHPLRRNRDYSASVRYARALAREILPRLERHAPTAGGRWPRAGMGTSLGALAMLHAHRTHPDRSAAFSSSRGASSGSATTGTRSTSPISPASPASSAGCWRPRCGRPRFR